MDENTHSTIIEFDIESTLLPSRTGSRQDIKQSSGSSKFPGTSEILYTPRNQAPEVTA